MSHISPWVVLFGLGAYHGINPGMGWLFAVALGMQEKNRGAILRALPPIALGHALSIGVVVGILWLAWASLPEKAVRAGAVAILIGFGIYRLLRSRHPAWVGMRVGFRDLTVWSFVMASAHGAGLMLLPVLLGGSGNDHAAMHLVHSGHMEHSELLTVDSGNAIAGPYLWFPAILVHTTGHLLVAAVIALLVYQKLGLALLRRAWFNLDLLWSAILFLSGAVILFL